MVLICISMMKSDAEHIFIYSWGKNVYFDLLPIFYLNYWEFCSRVECIYRVSLVPQLVKNLPAMQETWVQILGREDPLEEGTATHSSILA